MTRRKAFKRWEIKISNCGVTPHAIWPLAKFLMKRDGPEASTSLHVPSGLKFLQLTKTNTIASSLENQFTPHDICDENHEQRVYARVHALLEVVDISPLKDLIT
jgi:hypothetical protein